MYNLVHELRWYRESQSFVLRNRENGCFFVFERRNEIMLKSLGLFVALVFLLLSIIVVLNARWVIHTIDNSKDLENKMVGKIKVVSTLVSIISLFAITILIR